MELKFGGATPATDKGIEVRLDVVKPHTTVTLGLEGSIVNHRDLERRRQAGRSPVPPSKAMACVVNLDADKKARMERNPATEAALLDKVYSPLLSAAPDVVRMLFPRLAARTWSPRLDEAYVRMAAESAAEVVYVPSLGPKEKPPSVIERVQRAQATLDRKKTGQRAMPTVHIHADNMSDMMAALLGAAYPSIAIEMKGMKKVKDNLAQVHAAIRAVASPPYVVAFNVTREQDQATRVASALVLASFGVQASCQMVGQAFPAGVPKPRSLQRWFHPDHGAYRLQHEFPRPLNKACSCEVCSASGGDPALTVPSGLVFHESSNHEVDSRRLEARKMAVAIASGKLAPYIGGHGPLEEAIRVLS